MNDKLRIGKLTIPFYGIASVFMILVIFLFLWANNCGLGYTYDSNLYIDIAEQIVKNGLWNAEGLLIKPPGYPLLIALLGVGSLKWFNLAVLLFVTGIIFSWVRFITNSVLKLFYLGMIAFATPHFLVHSFAWTEPMFILVWVLAYHLLITQRKDHDSKRLLIVAILLILMPFIRYVGVIMIFPVFLFLFRYAPISKATRSVSLVALIIGSVVVLVWVINYQQGFADRFYEWTSSFRTGNFRGYIFNMKSYLKGLSIWIMPLSLPSILREGLTSILLGGLFFFSLRRFSHEQSGINLIPLVFLFYYLVMHTFFEVEYYSAERYLTPMYGLMVFYFYYQIDQLFFEKGTGLKKIMYVILFFQLIYGISRTTKNVIFWHEIRCKENSGISLPVNEQPLIYLSASEIKRNNYGSI